MSSRKDSLIMQRRWMVSVLPQLLVGFVSFMMLTEPTEAAPRGGFFGAFLGENDEEDKPKPPVPPMGQMIRPLVVSRPMPRPIAPPTIPTFVDEKPSPLRVESQTADNPVPAETEMAEATTDLDLSLNVAKVSAKPAPIDSAGSDSSDDAEMDSDEADMTLDEALANLDASEDELTFNAPANDEEMTGEAVMDRLAAQLYDELPPLEQEAREDGEASTDAEIEVQIDAEQEDEAEIAALELTEPSLDDQSLAEQVPHRSTTDAELSAEPNQPKGDTQSIDSVPAAPAIVWSPEMLALRKAIRATRDMYNQPLSTQVMPPSAVMQACVAFGSDAQLLTNARKRQTVNAVGALCWNYPCAGKRLLVATRQNVIPRIGHGLQSKRGELLATFAMAAISVENEIRIGESSGTIGDLVRWEQSNVRSGVDLSRVLFALSTYLSPDVTWTNSEGETWSLDRIAEEELNRRVSVTKADAIDRLIGLTRYVVCARRHDLPRTGRHLQVERYVARFHDHAMQLQGRDGKWGPLYFGYSASTDPNALSRQIVGSTDQESLFSTGNILLWLTMSLTPEQLQTPEIVRAAIAVNNGLASNRKRNKLSTFSPHELEMSMRCVRAISEYNRRVFEAAEHSKVAVKESNDMK
ncbi:MAG: hypothetical protein ACF787_03370 [Rhodopirellula sp. JB053]